MNPSAMVVRSSPGVFNRLPLSWLVLSQAVCVHFLLWDICTLWEGVLLSVVQHNVKRPIARQEAWAGLLGRERKLEEIIEAQGSHPGNVEGAGQTK